MCEFLFANAKVGQMRRPVNRKKTVKWEKGWVGLFLSEITICAE